MKPFKKEMMRILADSMPEDKLDCLPPGFQRVGDVAIVNLNDGLEAYGKKIGMAAMRAIPGIKTVCAKSGPVSGELRLPCIKVIAGNGTETTHVENGCRFRLDAGKTMFAKGNVMERARIPGLVRPGETVVDMFAGIGYFSIPIAVHSGAGKVYAIEKNPDSAHYLRENIRLNKAANVEAIEADNREVSLPSAADRVVMGYLPGTQKFLPYAFGFLKSRGVIHYHNICSKASLWARPVGELETEAGKAGYEIREITAKRVVKHYSPGVEHIVIDAVFEKPS